MATFRYKLQNILEIKYKMENQAKLAFALARRKLNDQQTLLEQMIMHKKELEDDYRDLAKGRLNVRDLIDGKKSIDFQKELIKGQMVEVRVAEKNLELATARLNEVMKDRKTHEKLRERAFDEFMNELNQTEKKEIDELVTYRFGSDLKSNV